MARNACVIVCVLCALNILFMVLGVLPGELTFGDGLELAMVISGTIGIAQKSRFCALLMSSYIIAATFAGFLSNDDLHFFGSIAVGLLNYSILHGTYCIFQLRNE